MKKMIGLVAPHVGAWIETAVEQKWKPFEESLPMWERGLKRFVGACFELLEGSLPMWERGLKLPALG